MKLYGHFISMCTRKVLLTLAEKEIKFDFQTVDLSKGEQKSPEYLAKHPFGVVPFLEDGDIRMYESRAICRYLDKKYSNNPLIPTNTQAFAKMEQFISIEQSYLDVMTAKIFHQRVLAPMRGAQSDLATIEQGIKGVNHAFSVMEKHLQTQPYFGGEQFSLADLFFMPYPQHLAMAKEGGLIENYPNLHNWWKRVSTRPSWQQFNK